MVAVLELSSQAVFQMLTVGVHRAHGRITSAMKLPGGGAGHAAGAGPAEYVAISLPGTAVKPVISASAGKGIMMIER